MAVGNAKGALSGVSWRRSHPYLPMPFGRLANLITDEVTAEPAELGVSNSQSVQTVEGLPNMTCRRPRRWREGGLAGEVATSQPPVDRAERRSLAAANISPVEAASGEAAARWRIDRARHVAL